MLWTRVQKFKVQFEYPLLQVAMAAEAYCIPLLSLVAGLYLHRFTWSINLDISCSSKYSEREAKMPPIYSAGLNSHTLEIEGEHKCLSEIKFPPCFPTLAMIWHLRFVIATHLIATVMLFSYIYTVSSTVIISN